MARGLVDESSWRGAPKKVRDELYSEESFPYEEWSLHDLFEEAWEKGIGVPEDADKQQVIAALRSAKNVEELQFV